MGNEIWELVVSKIPEGYVVSSVFSNKMVRDQSDFLISATRNGSAHLFIVSFGINGCEVRLIASGKKVK